MDPDYISQRNITDLEVLICIIGNFPDNGIDCSLSSPNICVRCPYPGRYVTGDKLNEYQTGYIVTIAISICAIIIGTFGTVTNSIIIIILLGKGQRRRTFELLLTGLACWDLLGSVTSVVTSAFSIVLYDNWDRGVISQLFSFYGGNLCYLARSGSTNLTLLIAIERYLVIAFPLRSIHWFNSGKTKCLMGLMLFISVLFSIPRFTRVKFVRNYFSSDIRSIHDWDYISLNTSFDNILPESIQTFVNAIDFCVPLPLLLVFNVLIFVKILKSNNRRKEMVNANQELEIKAVKMFIPVVVVLFLCNVEFYLFCYYLMFEKIFAREHCQGVLLSIAVNSAVNLPIYYFKGESFRDELKALISKCFGWFQRRGV